MSSKTILNCLLVIGLVHIASANLQENKGMPNLTEITWAHAVNSQELLTSALKSKLHMLEADVIIGTLKNTTSEIPIMAHPPNSSSDLSLEMFLQQIADHNSKTSNDAKGVKLDFKTLKAFQESKSLIEQHKISVKNIWLNADILNGPGVVNPNASESVNPQEFLNIVKTIDGNNTLSIGWATNWTKTMPENETKYDQQHINDMINFIKNNSISNRNITFPVRAVFVANSLKEMKNLLLEGNKTQNQATLTIWSNEDEAADPKKLSNVIKELGLNNVYLDVSDKFRSQMNINAGAGLKSSFLSFSIISFVMVILSELLKQ